MSSSRVASTVVLDAGPILTNQPSISTLNTQCDELFTTSDVISEIRDVTARSRYETIWKPFVHIREPSSTSYRIVSEFAKKTGDFAVLSKTDLGVIALARDLECERNGGDWRLNNTPGQNGRSYQLGKAANVKGTSASPGTYITKDGVEASKDGEYIETEVDEGGLYGDHEVLTDRDLTARETEVTDLSQHNKDGESEIRNASDIQGSADTMRSGTVENAEHTTSQLQERIEDLSICDDHMKLPASDAQLEVPALQVFENAPATSNESQVDSSIQHDAGGDHVKVNDFEVDNAFEDFIIPKKTWKRKTEKSTNKDNIAITERAFQTDLQSSQPVHQSDAGTVENSESGAQDNNNVRDDRNPEQSPRRRRRRKNANKVHKATIEKPSAVDTQSDPDSDGWITASNLHKHQARATHLPLARSQDYKTLKVATISGDFAIQNVLLQMNLNLLSNSLRQVRQIKSFVLRCHACFNIVKDMTKQFCPRCGQPTLTRVSCSTNASGEFKIYLSKKYQYNKTGDRYSIPKAQPGSANGRATGGGKGGWGHDLILAEDQKEYVKAVGEEKRQKVKDLMDEDYLPSIITGDRPKSNGRPRVGAGRNVNSKKRY
jgi:RNA-binding protein NOB1